MNRDISHLRENYGFGTLERDMLQEHPIKQFSEWFQAALDFGVMEPNAFVLSTIDPDEPTLPDSRVVLMKEIKSDGLVFYSNYESHKGRSIEKNPYVSINFLWLAMERQVRIRGRVEKLDRSESEKYFRSRPLSSQIGAWASRQSSVLSDRQPLEDAYAMYEAKFSSVEQVPMPDFWGGYHVIASEFEFWQGRESRLHDRFRYQKLVDSWLITRLSP